MQMNARATIKRIGACAVTFMLLLVLTPTIANAEPVQESTNADNLPFVSPYINGTLPDEKDNYFVPESEDFLALQAEDSLPAQYRSDEQPWAVGIQVKNQGQTGLCWAYTTTTAAEYSYAKETFSQTGAVSETSPMHLGYFLFNRVNDPLGNTAGDANRLLDESRGWPLSGGNQPNSMQHLATYSGLGLESNTPINAVMEHMYRDEASGTYVFDGTYPIYDDAFAYDDVLTIQEGIRLGLRDSDLQTKTNTIKQLVYQYGAACVSLQFDYLRFSEEPFISSETYEFGHAFYNYTGTARTNHGVTIVGWDDTYPASNFAHARDAIGNKLTYEVDGKTVELDDEQALHMTTPPGDGAWVVQNSWGPTRHDGGFFYLSYYSSEMTRSGSYVYAYDMQPADTYEYNFQYDGTADNGDVSDTGNEDFLTVAGTGAANVYTNTTGKPITIEAMGFTTFNQGETHYDISVYTALTSPADPTSGILAGTTRTTTVSAGVKTAVLDEPVVIGAGETYAIVCTFPDELTCFGVEKARSSTTTSFETQIDPGQSFFRGAGSDSWQDMYRFDACFRIKGLANGIEDASTARYTVVFEDGLGNIINTQSVTHGQAASAPQEPERWGYLFDGWDTDFSEVTTNLIVTATWKIDPTAKPTWERLAGTNRYETMSAIVQAGFDTSEWVVVATGTNYPDALVAASLAGLRECPIILTKGTSTLLDASARQTITQLQAKYAYVVGGTGTVSEWIEAQLKVMGLSVTRVAGTNRQDTSVAALAELAEASPDTVVIATGWSFADALSIGPWCYTQKAPILLAKDGVLNESQVEAVAATPSIKHVVIVGGPASVSDAVREQLGDTYTYERLAGTNRYRTSATIAEWELEHYDMNLEHVAVATGEDYPDALAGAALCGKKGSSLLLVSPRNVTPATAVLMRHKRAVHVGYVLGGTDAIPESLVNQLRAASLYAYAT